MDTESSGRLITHVTSVFSERRKLADNKVELEAEPGQVVEHSLGVPAICGAAVSADAFLDRPIDQAIFGVVVKNLVERKIDRLAIDFL